jgi:hypothetical protein
MIVFEVVHEDALVPTTETISNDILFTAGQYVYPYESITNADCDFKDRDLTKNSLQRTVCKWYGLAATTLSTFKKKLKYEFFDEFYKQFDVIMKKDCRNEIYIMLASMIIIYYFDIYNGKELSKEKIKQNIKTIIKNIADVRYTADPYGLKYTNYNDIHCDTITEDDINTLTNTFPNKNSIIDKTTSQLENPIQWNQIKTVITRYIS